MTLDIAKLELIEPSNQLLNGISEEVSLAELNSSFIQGVIDRVLELSAGKGHSKQDSRQMVGLAAVQLGVPKRIATIDLTADGSNKEQTLQVVINPVIVHISHITVPGREGCWSCGNVCGSVERAKEVVLEGLDRNGNPISLDLVDFIARIAQHEIDHLEGMRFPDRIPLDEPKRLHWVEPREFDEYRQNWATWPKLCARERWEALKAGVEDNFKHVKP